jgi:fructokinase
MSRVGNDALGSEILEKFRSLGIPAECVTVDPAAPTGTVSVELAPDGQPRFTIHENTAWDRIETTEASRKVLARADIVCFGSLAQRTPEASRSIQQMAALAPGKSLRIFDINLRQHFYSKEVIEVSLRLANALKVNDEELPVLAKMLHLAGGDSDSLSDTTFARRYHLPLGSKSGHEREQVAELAERFKLRLVALTGGARGSLLYADGRFSEHPGMEVKVVDTVGAGDAFAAAMALGFHYGWPLDEINQRANEVAAFVCTQPGATPPLPERLRGVFRTTPPQGGPLQ